MIGKDHTRRSFVSRNDILQNLREAPYSCMLLLLIHAFSLITFIGCVTRDYNLGGTCWHGLERETCTSDRVYVTRCDNDSNQRFNFEYVSGGEALIKVYGQNRCLDRDGWQVNLKPCKPENSSQRFIALNGSFNSYRFELSQKSARTLCLNQGTFVDSLCSSCCERPKK
jgi:hypothetical protein